MFFRLIQPKINNNKLTTVVTSDMKDKLEIGFWHKSANETNSDREEEGDDIAKSDLDLKESKIKQTVSSNVSKIQIR